ALPGRDVVGYPGYDIGVHLDAPHVDGNAVQCQLVRVHEWVCEVKVDVVMMEAGWQTSGIGVPKKNIEGRGRVAEQIIVDPVVPDQIIRPHPCEHARQLLAVEDTA